MKSLYSALGTNKNFERDGVDLDMGPVRIKVARAGGSNQKFKNLFTAKMKPFKFQLDNDLLDNDVAQRLMREVYAESVVLGWATNEGTDDKPDWKPYLLDQDGNKLPFTFDNCVKVLTDLPDLFALIQDYAGKAATFRVKAEEDDAKN